MAKTEHTVVWNSQTAAQSTAKIQKHIFRNFLLLFPAHVRSWGWTVSRTNLAVWTGSVFHTGKLEQDRYSWACMELVFFRLGTLSQHGWPASHNNPGTVGGSPSFYSLMQELGSIGRPLDGASQPERARKGIMSRAGTIRSIFASTSKWLFAQA